MRNVIAINIRGLDWGPLLGQASQTPGAADDVIAFVNGATVDPTDFMFL